MNNLQLFFSAEEIKKEIPSVEQHLHSNFSDGENSPEELINYALEKRIWRIAFTEHVRRDSDWYKDFIEVIRDLKEKYKTKIEILTGLEAKVINFKGEIDATDDQLNKAEIRIGSVHSYCKRGEDGQFCQIEDLSEKEALETELECALALIKNAKNSKINVVGHPFGVYLAAYLKSIPVNYWERIIREIALNNLAFDLNYRYHQDSFEIVLNLCDKFGVKINIGSDAHNLADVGCARKFKI